MRAQDGMTTEVVTAHPDAPARVLAKLMVEHSISGLPIVDEAGRLVGIVTAGAHASHQDAISGNLLIAGR
jgi:CBS domain-containing protein